MTRAAQHVEGYCPMGCGQTLAVSRGGHIYCANPDCPEQDAVGDILGKAETEHIVHVLRDGVTIKHPLRERLRDELENCTLLYALTVTYPPIVAGGIWRVWQDESGRPFGWEQMADR